MASIIDQTALVPCQTFNFLALPFVARCECYSWIFYLNAFTDGGTMYCVPVLDKAGDRIKPSPKLVAILHVSRQVRYEALPELLALPRLEGENVTQYNERGGVRVVINNDVIGHDEVPRAIRQNIRFQKIRIWSHGEKITKAWRMLWSFPGLEELQIIHSYPQFHATGKCLSFEDQTRETFLLNMEDRCQDMFDRYLVPPDLFLTQKAAKEIKVAMGPGGLQVMIDAVLRIIVRVPIWLQTTLENDLGPVDPSELPRGPDGYAFVDHVDEKITYCMNDGRVAYVPQRDLTGPAAQFSPMMPGATFGASQAGQDAGPRIVHNGAGSPARSATHVNHSG